jgi:hypothetical protein
MTTTTTPCELLEKNNGRKKNGKLEKIQNWQ